MEQNPIRPAAVYKRGLGYSDECTIIPVSQTLEDLLARWRAGEDVDISSAFAEHNDSDAEPDQVLSVHDTIAEATKQARQDHIELSAQTPLVGMGFYNLGCLVEVFPYDPERPVAFDQDLPRFKQWCTDNGVSMPASLDPSDPQVFQACKAIADRTMEGDLWLSFFEEGPDAAMAFAADLVADELRSSGRADLAADLFTHLLCDLTYVGPPPSKAKQKEKPKPGFFRLLFGK